MILRDNSSQNKWFLLDNHALDVISTHEACVFIKNPFGLRTKRIVCLGNLPRWFTDTHCGPDRRLIDAEPPKPDASNGFVNPSALMGISEALGPASTLSFNWLEHWEPRPP
ncbi:hypothetical protein M9458_005111, partial [Cirrhinus mrigala]